MKKTEMLVAESEALAETPKRNKEFNTSRIQKQYSRIGSERQ